MTGPAWPDLLTVHVTQGHIDDGRPCSAEACPIALAVTRLLLGEGSGYRVHVESGTITILARPHHVGTGCDALVAAWRMPGSARQFAADFDFCDPVAPFTFAAERVT